MADITGELATHIKSLRRYAMALTRHPSDADDLVQETLRRALSYSGKNSEIRDVRAYLFTILRNVRFDTLARISKTGPFVSLTDSVIQLPCQPSQELRVQCRELDAALQKLSEEQREVILLVALEGLTYQGAASLLDIPIGTVMSRLNRGREALRLMLGARFSPRPATARRGAPQARMAV